MRFKDSTENRNPHMDLLHLYLRPTHTRCSALTDYKLVSMIAYAENGAMFCEKLIQLVLRRPAW